MLADVWAKFRLFQKPANFDSRLSECERVLAGVKSQVAVLDIRSVEQDVVQSQLEQCMVGDRMAVVDTVYAFVNPVGTPALFCLCLTEAVQGAE